MTELKGKWELVNPEGKILAEAVRMNAHPDDLKGKTVVLQWNGKHNGDVFLGRIGELLNEKIKDVKVIRGWEADPYLKRISNNPEISREMARRLARLKPDIVIGMQGD